MPELSYTYPPETHRESNESMEVRDFESNEWLQYLVRPGPKIKPIRKWFQIPNKKKECL